MFEGAQVGYGCKVVLTFNTQVRFTVRFIEDKNISDCSQIRSGLTSHLPGWQIIKYPS